ncbi:hypothetical protein T265_12687, partial [Opisthorchis viverrini]
MFRVLRVQSKGSSRSRTQTITSIVYIHKRLARLGNDCGQLHMYFRYSNLNAVLAPVAWVKLRNFSSCVTYEPWDPCYDKYSHLQINPVFMGDTSESIVYDVLQLNVLHTVHLMFQL